MTAEQVYNISHVCLTKGIIKTLNQNVLQPLPFMSMNYKITLACAGCPDAALALVLSSTFFIFDICESMQNCLCLHRDVSKNQFLPLPLIGKKAHSNSHTSVCVLFCQKKTKKHPNL